jgi:hypothetical protein
MFLIAVQTDVNGNTGRCRFYHRARLRKPSADPGCGLGGGFPRRGAADTSSWMTTVILDDHRHSAMRDYPPAVDRKCTSCGKENRTALDWSSEL